VKADPKFAIGHAGLAEAQWAIYSGTNDKTWAERAMNSTKRALELEPNRPSVRYTAALTLFRSGQHAEAE
jgi:predicted Zn-dependent protease